ncbi:hypothetical protein GYMLUDRAFT_235627 [Collybiopsis luxurians FD-317 M1]|nr:hypothetical protein GYMLUDRAFT_235627 [Collybiopsis luxurians FD-317 M1]
MFAFPASSAVLLLLVVIFLADNVSALPFNAAQNEYTGSSGNAPGGDVRPASVDSQSCSGGSCARPLLDIFSNNAGDGGVSSSGDALSPVHGVSTTCKRNNGVPDGKFTGAAGDTPGGSANDDNAWIKFFSGNAGHGGASHSGSAIDCS